jgi:hypothetical protein
MIKKWLAPLILEIIEEAKKPPISMKELHDRMLETIIKDSKDFELERQNRLK